VARCIIKEQAVCIESGALFLSTHSSLWQQLGPRKQNTSTGAEHNQPFQSLRLLKLLKLLLLSAECARRKNNLNHTRALVKKVKSMTQIALSNFVIGWVVFLRVGDLRTERGLGLEKSILFRAFYFVCV
jgi:hypothetical protein